MNLQGKKLLLTFTKSKGFANKSFTFCNISGNFKFLINKSILSFFYINEDIPIESRICLLNLTLFILPSEILFQNWASTPTSRGPRVIGVNRGSLRLQDSSNPYYSGFQLTFGLYWFQPLKFLQRLFLCPLAYCPP